MSLLEHVSKAASAQIARQAAGKSGLSEGLVEKVMPMAMAALMGGIQKNAANPDGAEALAKALDRHDGGLLNDVSRLGDDDVLNDGRKILGHVLGAKQPQTERALAKVAGVDEGQIGQLLAMAAPALLASLGRAKRERSLDVAGLAGLVTEEGIAARRDAPRELGGLLSFIDQDGDGDVQDDLLEAAGKKLLGGLFGRK